MFFLNCQFGHRMSVRALNAFGVTAFGPLTALMLFLLAISLQSDVAASPQDDRRPTVAIMIGEPEYKTSQTLPRFADQFLRDDYRVVFVMEDSMAENRFPGIDQITDADVLVISVRRKTLPKEQLDVVRQYVEAGKPVIGIRTANHAFCLRNQDAPQGCDQWPEFDAEVFGGNYTGHHARDLPSTVRVAESAKTHPIVAGVSDEELVQIGSLYKTAPVAEAANVLLNGELRGNDGKSGSVEPVAWTFERSDGGRSFYTSLGHPAEFANPVCQKLLRAAIDWAVSP